MKNLYSVLLIMGALFAFVLFAGNSSGRANGRTPRTGAPSGAGVGTEGTCSQCHSSGASTFGEPLLTWTIADAGGMNVNSYVPGQTYNVTVAVTVPDLADGATPPAAYGFSSVFLDDTAAPDGPDAEVAGSFGNLSSFTQLSDPSDSDRVYVEQNDRTPSGVWTFDWTAPAVGFGEVRIYSTGNAVNSNFSTGGDSGSTMSTIITLQEAATLPVTLARFTARTEKSDILLTWSTELEENASHFELERSSNGGDFSAVTELAAKARTGGANYLYSDTGLAGGTYAYRLKMVDLDGSSAFSPVVNATVDHEEGFRVWPNPTAGPLTISTTDENVSYRLLNANGAVIRDNVQAGQQDISGLKAGMYLLEMTSATGRSVQRVVKQ